jgi:hypothetical protein
MHLGAFVRHVWLVPSVLATSACGAASGQVVTPATFASIAIARTDADDPALRAALHERALQAFPACNQLARDRPTGHLDLWVDVSASGKTVAGILHGTFDDETSECLARALTDVTVPARGDAYRVRVRLEGR